ncbi:MAG: hypothetical protein U9R54_05340 [Bacteroidota bacterium]|nr:hypothetical protein [Bacteroidota bacterium]
MMIKSVRLLLVVFAIALCAFQCDEELVVEPLTSEAQIMKIQVSPNSKEINLGDTLWLYGKVTSKVLEYESQDSILCDNQNIFVFFYRLKTPINEQDYNTTPAASEFQYYQQNGAIEKEDYSWSHTPEAHSHWDNLHRIITPELSDSTNFYLMKIGIIPTSIGYFALNCFNTFNVLNFNRDLYSQFDNNTTYSFFAKGRYGCSWAPIDNRLYFFKVIN